MPIYEYVCEQCGHALEALQKISETPLRDCPACDKDALKKKISAPGFRLSGSGWYETDFKSKNQKNLSKGDSAAGGSSLSKDKPADGGSSKAGSKDTKASKEAAA
ncbi:MAG: zinc ribbon domain-containing protein [Gammaproteobacteria bacterium]|nr:zinc ribbon domain-containing protein [Gammaproteobacteria bacterium]